MALVSNSTIQVAGWAKSISIPSLGKPHTKKIEIEKTPSILGVQPEESVGNWFTPEAEVGETGLLAPTPASESPSGPCPGDFLVRKPSEGKRSAVMELGLRFARNTMRTMTSTAPAPSRMRISPLVGCPQINYYLRVWLSIWVKKLATKPENLYVLRKPLNHSLPVGIETPRSITLK